jgi:hypothetical protein
MQEALEAFGSNQCPYPKTGCRRDNQKLQDKDEKAATLTNSGLPLMSLGSAGR